MPRQHRYELIAVPQHVIQRGNNRLFPHFLLKRIIIATSIACARRLSGTTVRDTPTC
jgi:hypothetical protein